MEGVLVEDVEAGHFGLLSRVVSFRLVVVWFLEGKLRSTSVRLYSQDQVSLTVYQTRRAKGFVQLVYQCQPQMLK